MSYSAQGWGQGQLLTRHSANLHRKLPWPALCCNGIIVWKAIGLNLLPQGWRIESNLGARLALHITLLQSILAESFSHKEVPPADACHTAICQHSGTLPTSFCLHTCIALLVEFQMVLWQCLRTPGTDCSPALPCTSVDALLCLGLTKRPTMLPSLDVSLLLLLQSN